jgi:hypothetical protein
MRRKVMKSISDMKNSSCSDHMGRAMGDRRISIKTTETGVFPNE